uniref:Juvenile hormone epoxide hydrolase n=1 Tax=Bombyx mori TaxID=7091 RepID=HYEP_BOMMO|nr:RecName: Full=Juvenile hormone epoxide hydrolase; Short=bommo-JHEH [Bombyx mori]AAQ87024.1 juvenile hormone epoxide hydrolase [Bombyx mori]
MSRLLFIALPLLVLASIPLYLLVLKSPPPMPKLDLEEWWGPPELKQKQDTSIKPFEITFSETMVKELKERIKKRRPFAPPLEGVGFKYGFNSKQLDSWLKYWAEEYPFAERQKFLNQYPHFKTNIQGLNIHFMRITPKVPKDVEIVPLLLLHGWPGSVREFYEAIPHLTAVSRDRNFALEIIAPSLPGYGFSDAAVRPGLAAAEVAVIFKNLMARLGYKQYYVQGGDWGALIGSAMATSFPKEIIGFHSYMALTLSPAATFLEFVGALFPSLIVEPELANRLYPLSEKYSTLLEELGYMHIQATKPDTVGIGLTDSPAGLLAYILEKFSTWTNPDLRSKEDGGLSYRWTKDQLIDNLMLYWSTKSIVTSMRLYAESFSSRHFDLKLDEIQVQVPTWVLQAKHELAYQPPCILKLKYTKLVNASVIEDGGHFLAFELPEIFAKDVLKAIGEFRKLKNVKTEL